MDTSCFRIPGQNPERNDVPILTGWTGSVNHRIRLERKVPVPTGPEPPEISPNPKEIHATCPAAW